MTVDYSLTLYLNLNLSVPEIISNSLKKVDLNVLAFKPCGQGIGYIVIRALTVLAETFYLCCRLLKEKSLISSELSCYFFHGY